MNVALCALFYLTAAQRQQMLFTSTSHFIGFESHKSSSFTSLRGSERGRIGRPGVKSQTLLRYSGTHVQKYNKVQFCSGSAVSCV